MIFTPQKPFHALLSCTAVLQTAVLQTQDFWELHAKMKSKYLNLIEFYQFRIINQQKANPELSFVSV